MGVVRFASYRQYDAARIDASNAMMALLAGAQLASHLLKLTEGSERLLPEVYPQVPHIGRFNLTSEAARAILDTADLHLGAMGVPYALAIHEDYLKTCLLLLARAGRCRKDDAEKSLAGQHAAIAAATGGTFGSDAMAQLTTFRLMRNCTIHAGGRADTRLVGHLRTWSGTTEAGWLRLARRSPRALKVGDLVTFGQSEMILALAVTKTLDREANELLQSALPRDLWADLVIEDLIADNPGSKGAPDALRRARGLARYHYGGLGLTSTELQDALARR